MYLNKVNLILSNTSRSASYIKILKKNKIKINLIILYGFKKSFNYGNFPATNKVKLFHTKRINYKIINYLKSSKENYFFISPNQGEIIQNKQLLNQFKILHFHPGKLPKFKGSTILYYTKLLKKNYYCSCFRLGEKIDTGDIYFQKKFKNIKFNEKNYDKIDNFIRSKTFIAFLKNKKKKVKINTKKINVENYYIIHPLLRKISVNTKFKRSLKNFLLSKYKI